MEELFFQNTRAGFDFEAFSGRLERFFSENKVPLCKSFAVELIVEELVTNIIKYGQHAAPDISVRIRYNCKDELVLLEIRDNSLPFDPTSTDPSTVITDPDLPIEERQIGGLGIFLVREKAASMVYEYRDHCNIITLTV